MDGWEFILIYVLAIAAAVLYFLWIFKWKRSINPFRRKSSSPTEHTAPSITTSIFDFITGLALICWGQSLVALPGTADYPISSWLNGKLRFDTGNLDNVLVGLPILWAGCCFIIQALNHIGIFGSQEKSDGQLIEALPSKLLWGKLAKAVAGGLIFSLLLVNLASGHYSGFMPVLWIVSILIFCFLTWQWDRQAGVSLSLNLARKDLLWITALVLAGLVVASFSLQNIPNQLVSDEGVFWNTARNIANGSSQTPLFGVGVNTFGILSSIFQGLVLQIFGINLWSWRFSSVLAGIAAIPPLYLLGREMFNRRVAVASVIALFTAPYFLAFARLGYNNIQTLFVVTLALYLFYSGYRRKSALYLFLAGCAAGLGTYTFTSASAAFYIVLLFLGLSLFQHSINKRTVIKTAGIFILGWLLLSTPYYVYGQATALGSFSHKPFESIFFNTGYGMDQFGNLPAFVEAPRFVIDQASLFFSPGLYGILLVRATFRTLLSYNNPFLVTEHFIASPLAGPIAVIFFTIGSVLALFRLRQRRFAFLILWFGFNLLAYSITMAFPPRHQVMLGAIPVMALFIGLGMVTCVDMLARLIPRLSSLARTFFWAALVVGVGVSGVYNYFVSMPAAYVPDFEQIISWYSLYAKGQFIDYVYNDQENPDFKPYVLQEIRKDVNFTMIPAADFAAHPEAYPLNQGSLLFYAPDSSSLVMPALTSNYGNKVKEIVYNNKEGQPIGIAAWLPPLSIRLPATFNEMLVDSYLRPVSWVMLALLILLAFFGFFQRSWLKNTPAWLQGGLDWFAKLQLKPLTLVESRPELSLSIPATDLALSEAALTGLADPVEISRPVSEPLVQSSLSEPALPVSQIDTRAADTSRPFIEFDLHMRINFPPKLFQGTIAFPRPAAPAKTRTRPAIRQRLPNTERSRAFQDRIAILSHELISREKWIPTGLMLSAIILAFVGQQELLNHQLEPGIWYLLTAGLVYTIYSLISGYVAPAAANEETDSEYLIASPQLRHRLVFSAGLIATANFFLLQARNDQRPYWDLFTLWIISILLFMLAFLPKIHLKLPSINLSEQWKKWLPLAVILLTGLAARFYLLGRLPDFMDNDEGKVGVETMRVLNGSLTNMFQTFEGFGTLHFFIMAIPVKLFGQTRFAICFDSALYGFLALPVIYVLARKMFDHRVALVSTALLAVAHLHIQFSRISPSASSLDPLLAALSFLLVYYGLQSRRTITWVLAGMVMGLGLYFYVGARVLIFILAGFLILQAIFNRRQLWENRFNVVALAGAYLVAAAPMLLWAVINPDNFNARSNQVGIIQNGWLAAEMIHQNLPAWRILLQQFANSLLIFNFFNAAGFYNATIPALGPITGAAFAFGLLAALLRLRDTRFALLSSWFWVTLIIGQVLVVSPWASAYRTLGITPAVCILAAVALVHLADRLFSSWPKISRTAAVVIIALALVFEGGWNLWNYFGVWAPRNNFPDPESQLASLIGDYMAQQPLNSMTYMAALPDYTASGWATIEYLRNSRPFEDIKIPMDQALPTLKFAPRTVFIFPPERQNELAIVQKAYPGGQVVKRYVGNQLFFTAYQK